MLDLDISIVEYAMGRPDADLEAAEAWCRIKKALADVKNRSYDNTTTVSPK